MVEVPSHMRDAIEIVCRVFGAEIGEIRRMDTAEITEAKRKADYQAWVDEAAASGRKPGWAAYQYKDQYGDWPPREWSQPQLRANATAEEKRAELKRLLDVAKNKGLKIGWAAHKYKEQFGEWPPKEKEQPAPKPQVQFCSQCGNMIELGDVPF